MNTDLFDVPTPMLIALGVTAALQFVLSVVTLIVLARTPRERLHFEKKWPWVLIILLINFVGAILFLAIGRRPPTATEHSIVPPQDHQTAHIVQSLYGGDPE